MFSRTLDRAAPAALTAAPDVVPAVACVSIVAGLVHAVAATGHMEEHVLFGVFFAALAIAQIGWGIAVWSRPSSALLRAGVAGSAAVIALWAISRKVGLPIGSHAGVPESVGVHDAAATVSELLIMAVCAALSSPAGGRAAARSLIDRWVPAAGMAVAALSLTALMTTGGHH